MHDSGRAVSELVGFVLIFAVVLLTIALVGMTDVTGLDNAREYHTTTNAEQAFTMLSLAIDDVTSEGVPSRETELRLSEATLAGNGQADEFAITVENGTAAMTHVVETTPIVYETDAGTTITYSNGLLVREEANSVGEATIFDQPDFVIDEETVIVPLIETSINGDERVGGTTAVGVHTASEQREVLVRDEDSDGITVTIAVRSERVDVWQDYLDEATAGGCEQPVGETVECTIETESVLVKSDTIAVSFR